MSDWASFVCLFNEYVNNSLNILLEIYLNLCQSCNTKSFLHPRDIMDIKTGADLHVFTRWSALITELGS